MLAGINKPIKIGSKICRGQKPGKVTEKNFTRRLFFAGAKKRQPLMDIHTAEQQLKEKKGIGHEEAKSQVLKKIRSIKGKK